MSTKKESCGCGFGHSVKKVHFGSDLPTFYKQNATNSLYLSPGINACLNSTTRFGKQNNFSSKTKKGPMKIPK